MATDPPARALGEIDVIRVQELHHITDVFGNKIWPGFDTRKVPRAINNDNKEELLVGHPNPPKEYHPFKDFELNGRPVLVRDGANRYGPRGGGWAVDIGGKQTAYVSTLREGSDTAPYLSLILHECFHVGKQKSEIYFALPAKFLCPGPGLHRVIREQRYSNGIRE